MGVRGRINHIVEVCEFGDPVTILSHGVGKNNVQFIRARATTKNGHIDIEVRFKKLRDDSVIDFLPLAQALIIDEYNGKKHIHWHWDCMVSFRTASMLARDAALIARVIKSLEHITCGPGRECAV